MQGDAQTVKHLNIVLKNQLTPINQYFLHSRMFSIWGLNRLQEHENHESIDEMKHADRLAALAHRAQVGDYMSRRLLTGILESEEEHIDWLETQKDLIGRIELERYTQSQILVTQAEGED